MIAERSRTEDSGAFQFGILTGLFEGIWRKTKLVMRIEFTYVEVGVEGNKEGGWLGKRGRGEGEVLRRNLDRVLQEGCEFLIFRGEAGDATVMRM